MTNQRIELGITLLLATIIACSAFTTTPLRRTTTCTPTVARWLNKPEVFQQQSVRAGRASPFLESNGMDCYQRSLPVLSESMGSDDVSSASSEDESLSSAAAVPAWKRTLMFYKYNKDGSLKVEEDDGLTFKQKLAKMGLSALLSYGFVSNISYCFTVSLAWFGFSKKTGLSPLAPGQWKGFLAVYAGFYVFNNFIRPMRLAVSIGVTPYFDKAVAAIQRKTKFSKSVSIGIVVFLANVCGTTSLMSLGIYIASLAAGVPIFAK